MLSLVSASLEALSFFSHPLVYPLVSLPILIDTSVSSDKCPSDECLYLSEQVFSRNRCSVPSFLVFSIPVKFTQVCNHAISFTCVYSQTHSLKARLWEVSKCHSHFPIFKKSAALCMLFVVELENAHGFRVPKGSLDCSPNSSSHWSHSLLRFFGHMAVASEKVLEGSANYSLHLCPKWLLLHKNSLEGSANCVLHLSLSLLLGPKLRELLTCFTHTNAVRRKRPIMSLLLGYSLGLFSCCFCCSCSCCCCCCSCFWCWWWRWWLRLWWFRRPLVVWFFIGFTYVFLFCHGGS